MQLFFIRHAQSFNNALWERTGSSNGRSEDPELTETGIKQAKILAKQFAHSASDQEGLNHNAWKKEELHLTHLYTSLMIRAVSTGIEVAKCAGLKLMAWPDIHEGGGIFVEDPETGVRVGRAGKRRRFFEENYPELILPPNLEEGGWWNRPHESTEECEARARMVIDTLLSRHGSGSDRVAMISHVGFYNVFLRVLFQIPEQAAVWFALNNCGITRIDFAKGEMGLVYANRLDFMPVDLIS
ncbi:MAG: histidine phosphatase family protein [Anaerolineae bacterium]|nr:histidine phosphatase family protein [Anaerolineae bacterium]